MIPEYEAELERLRSGTIAETSRCCEGLSVQIVAQATSGNGGAQAMLEKTVEVLECVIGARARDDWPASEVWGSIMPPWFVDACSTEMSDEETARWLEHWRWSSKATRAEMEKQKGWSLEEWLHWFAPGPDERQWRWGSAFFVDGSTLQMTVCVEGLPFASGALRWLIQTAGAENITVLD